MASPYVPDTDQFTQNLLSLFMQKQQNSRQDALIQNELKRENDLRKLETASAQALDLRGLETLEEKRTGIARLARTAIEEGGDPMAWERLLTIGDKDELNLALRQMALKSDEVRGMIGKGASAGQREFESLIKDFSPEDQKKARRVKAGLDARKVGSADITIAEDDLTDIVAESKGDIAGAVEGGKLTKQLEFKPQIESAVTKARAEATRKGEVLTEFNQAKAALPGLTSAVNELRELAQMATSTIGGRVFDAAVKETGFGATKGATARAKFIAIVNNQVLPLLKPTFGAAFTVQEGEALKATMGDPNATPEEKMVQLDAFIAQKLRDIETKEAQLDQAPATGGIKFLGFE